MDLPTHIASALKLEEPYSKELIADAAQTTGLSVELFDLSAEEFTSALERNNVKYAVRPAPASLDSWAFLEISLGSDLQGRALVIPENPDGPPPTAAGQFLVETWVEIEDLVSERSLKKNLVLTGEESGSSSWGFYNQFIDAWIRSNASHRSSKKPIWVGVTSIQLATDARLLRADVPKLKFSSLLLESLSEIKAKWRLLALYRIFEHGYLSEIYEKIQRDFFQSPKDTLDTSRKSIESEVRQFDALIESASLGPFFEKFLDSFDASKLALNHYACAIDRSLNKDGQLSQVTGKAGKGVLVCYKIRCSIVHSGLSAPIFEAYPDASECLEELINDLEAAAFSFLGITIA